MKRRLLIATAAFPLIAAILSWAAPVGWAFELVAEFRVQFRYLAFAALAVPILWRGESMKTRGALAIGSLVAIILQTWAIHPWEIFQPPKGLEADITVLQANLYYKNGNLSAIQKLLDLDADILALYEVKPIHEPFLIAAHARFPYRAGSTDAVILSRYPIREIERKKTPNETRTIFVEIATPHGKVNVGSLHPSVPLLPQTKAARDWVLYHQAGELAKLPAPKLLVGDFNTTMFSHAFAETERLSGCVDTGRGLSPRGTWPAYLPGPLRIRIDHLFASPDVKVVSKREGPSTGSDHLPVITVLDLP